MGEKKITGKVWYPTEIHIRHTEIQEQAALSRKTTDDVRRRMIAKMEPPWNNGSITFKGDQNQVEKVIRKYKRKGFKLVE